MIHKSKLGLSVGLIGGCVYLCGLFGGIFTLALLTGFILLEEENMWLRRTSLKAMVLLLAVYVLQALISLLPDLMRIFSSFAALLNTGFHPQFIYDLESFLLSVVRMGKNVMFLLLGLFAFDQRDLQIGKLDRWIEKKLKE